jgi:hypothetical protein
MRLRPALTFLLLLAASGGAAPATAQLDVGPLVRTLHTADGRGVISVAVRNTGSARIEVTVDVNDWAVDSAGQHTFRPAGTFEYSCGARLLPDHRTLVLDPGAVARVQVAFNGAHAEVCRNIVFFRVTEAPDVLEGDRLIISTGVKVYVEPAPTG